MDAVKRAGRVILFKQRCCDGQGGNGGGFGAKDARAEADRLPASVIEEGFLLGGPSSFRADGKLNLRKIISRIL